MPISKLTTSYIFAHTALAPQPSQRPFHHPAPRSHDKPLDVGRRCDDLQLPGAFGRAPRGPRLSALGAISPDALRARLQRLESNEQTSYPCLVGGIGRRDIDRQEQPERVHRDMAFPTRLGGLLPLSALYSCVFAPKGYSGAGAAVCCAARSGVGSIADRGMEYDLRCSRSREYREPSPGWRLVLPTMRLLPPYEREPRPGQTIII